MNHKQQEQLHQALLSAFPDYNRLERMVRFGLDENLEAIAGSGKLEDVVFNLIAWAVACGREVDLVRAARQSNPGNAELQAFAQSVRTGPPMISNPVVTPTWTIDREPELRAFEALLTHDDPTRVLLIQDRPGSGKSHLLRHFFRICTSRYPTVPISLVDLRETRITSPILLIKAIARDLTTLGVNLPRYDFVDRFVRSRADWSRLLGTNLLGSEGPTGPTSASTTAYLPDMSGFGTSAQPVQPSADDITIAALLEDMNEYCNKHPLIVMIDSFEQGNILLQEWVAEHLLTDQVFNRSRQTNHLLLIVAGQWVPGVERYHSSLDDTRIIKHIARLSEWKRVHVEECLQQLGLSYSSVDTDFYYQHMLRSQLTPFDTILLMETVRRMTNPANQ